MDLLIIKTSSFGDIVHGLQAIDSLRRQWERAGKRGAITWLVQDRFAGLVEASGIAETCWTFSRRDRFLGDKALRARLRSRRFDLVLDLQGRWKTGYWTWLARADRKIGRADAREFAGMFYPEKPALPPGGRYGSHALDILLNYLPLLGGEATLAGPLRFPGGVKPEVDPAVLARRPILIFPDSAQAVKEWPGHRELTRELANAYPTIPILWPGWSDMAPPSGLRHDNFVNLMKRVPLKSLPEVVGSARLVIAKRQRADASGGGDGDSGDRALWPELRGALWSAGSGAGPGPGDRGPRRPAGGPVGRDGARRNNRLPRRNG